MKCQDFETIIIDLARDRMMEAAERETALAHAQGCSECAGRLADERALTAGLRRLAAASQTTQAPARVQSALQAAFHEQLRIRNATTGADDLERKPWRRRAWAVAAAAMILVAAGFISWRIARIPPGDELERAHASQAEGPTGTAPSPARPEQENGFEAPRRVLPVFKPGNRARSPRLRPHKSQSDRPGKGSNPAAEPAEIATDFIPMSGADLMPLDGGLVVRVELPRSALVSFGLPMNMERAGERIKADVVVGNDGLARAIRFVH